MKSRCTLTRKYFWYLNQVGTQYPEKSWVRFFPFQYIFKVLFGELFLPKKSDINLAGRWRLYLGAVLGRAEECAWSASGPTSPFPSGCEVLTVALSVNHRITLVQVVTSKLPWRAWLELFSYFLGRWIDVVKSHSLHGSYFQGAG